MRAAREREHALARADADAARASADADAVARALDKQSAVCDVLAERARALEADADERARLLTAADTARDDARVDADQLRAARDSLERATAEEHARAADALAATRKPDARTPSTKGRRSERASRQPRRRSSRRASC